MYHRQQNKCISKGVYLPVSKLHSILAGPNLLFAGRNLLTSKFATAIIECSFEKVQVNTFGGIIYFAFNGTIASKINGTPKGVYSPISKLHSNIAVSNLLAHNNISQI